MIALLCFFVTLFASLFKSKSRLEAENAALRHQLIVVQRKMRGRVHRRRPHSSLDGTTPDHAYFTPLPLRIAA